MSETHKLRTEDIEPKTNQFKGWNVEAEKVAKACLVSKSNDDTGIGPGSGTVTGPGTGPGPATVPSLDHLRMADYDQVYEPSDDTYLMLDALNWDFGSWRWTAGGSGSENENESESESGDACQCKGENGHNNDNDTNSNGDGNDDDDDDNNVQNRITTLELGCGTGVNTIFLAQLLSRQQQQQQRRSKKKKLVHIVTDINKHAIQVTKRTAQQNIPDMNIDANININTDADADVNISENDDQRPWQQSLQTHLCDLATPLLQTHKRQIDILIFNPPYVPTPDEEVGQFYDGDPQSNANSDTTSTATTVNVPTTANATATARAPPSIEASWAGGTDGRVVIDKSLPQIASLLSYPHGVAYMITVDDNRPEEIASIMMDKYDIVVKPFLRRRARNEFLTVVKMTHSKHQH